MYRVVLDTNVVFEGLTSEQSECGVIVNLWRAGLIDVFVTDALALEYKEVLARKLSPQRWERLKILLTVLLDISTFIMVNFTWRPMSPDPDDDMVIDCGMNANAIVVTGNIKDFRRANEELGLPVMTPHAFLQMFTESD